MDGVYLFASPASKVLFGWDPDRLVGQCPEAFVHPDDAGLVISARDRALQTTPRAVAAVFRFRCADATYRWAETLSTSVHDGTETLIVSTVRDIGDRRKLNLDLWRQATTDPLTGVANRAVLVDRLQHALRRLERHTGLVGILFLDLDGFKVVNDTLGHQGGDAVLLQLAERLRRLLRPPDTLARLGGDEF